MDISYTGNKIMELRKQHNMTQKELAALLSVTDKAVSKWERGLNFPDLLTLEKLADVLHTSVVELLGIEQHTTRQVAVEIADIANSEKQSLLKEIVRRNWLTIVVGVWLYCSFTQADKMLYDMNIHGIGILGRATWLGLIIGNAATSVANARRLQGKHTVVSVIWQGIRGTGLYSALVTLCAKAGDIGLKIALKSPVNILIDSFFKDK